ncbi:hypothetical protein S1OALGB6SA_1095 [Olavius algarvensis spirochete endosymbiont]|nr:MAG: hypothetical protein [Olavius algarvensis spirochete endosymbiont]VDB00022.1 hypothetical protein S1OALGB6SA_1095 [Olavius algarvensis spirochete endosymbiont]
MVSCAPGDGCLLDCEIAGRMPGNHLALTEIVGFGYVTRRNSGDT